MLMSSPANLNLQPAPSSSATPTGTPAHSQADLHFFVAHSIKNQFFFLQFIALIQLLKTKQNGSDETKNDNGGS